MSFSRIYQNLARITKSILKITSVLWYKADIMAQCMELINRGNDWWRYFTKREGNTTQCNICDMICFFTPQNLSSLREHLKCVHDIELSDLNRKFGWMWKYYLDIKYAARCSFCRFIIERSFKLLDLEGHLVVFHKEHIVHEQIHWVWQYYKEKQSEGKLECNRCGKMYTPTNQNLMFHLRKDHQITEPLQTQQNE